MEDTKTVEFWDEPERTSDIRRLYSLSHHSCAYCQLLPQQLLRKLDSRPQIIELDHIWQRAGQKIDHQLNYIMACRPCHSWKHQNLTQARIAALYWKISNNEFDNQKLQQLIGINPLGWTESQLSNKQLPQWTIQIAQQILDTTNQRKSVTKLEIWAVNLSDGDWYWVFARSPRQAIKIVRDTHYEMSDAEFRNTYSPVVRKLPPNKQLTVNCDDGQHSKTADQWTIGETAAGPFASNTYEI